MAASGPRKSVSIYDYPEHLNPFREEDNHNKIRFWTIGRKMGRNNSFSLSNFKDIRNTWTLKSFMKRGKKSKTGEPTPKIQVNGEPSPIVYRRALEYSSTSTAAGAGARSTVASPERYVYGGSITPLPRSRFQERMRSPSQQEVNGFRSGTMERASFAHRTGYLRDNDGSQPGLTRTDVNSSRLSVESTNPFEDDAPVRASRRKKKRAPMPPSANVTTSLSNKSFNLDSSVESKDIDSEEQTKDNTLNTEPDLEIEDLSLNIELKIIEDDDKPKEESPVKNNNKPTIQPETSSTAAVVPETSTDSTIVITNEIEPQKQTETGNNNAITNPIEIKDTNDNDKMDDSNNNAPFARVNIVQYRRNSSFNDDTVRLRRSNLEDPNPLSNKRSKSLSNTANNNDSFTAYDINLHIDEDVKDINDNDSNQPQKVVCKLVEDTSRKHSIDNSISSTEREFIEIDRTTRELVQEISKLSPAIEPENEQPTRWSVSQMKLKFDKANSPNPIPKPRRSRFDSSSPVNGKL